MYRIDKEYSLYENSSVMKKLAMIAHGKNFCDQTSSANFLEISKILLKYDITSTSNVLDLGCGNGTFSIQIAKMFQCFVHGVDISSNLVNIAKIKTKSHNLENFCKFQSCDFFKLSKIKDFTFDFIIIIGSLYWSSELNNAMSLWKRKLNKNGKIVIFLNVKKTSLTRKEQEKIDNTAFISFNDLLRSIKDNKLKIIQLKDRTATYLKWLVKWCNGINLLKKNIHSEMGDDAATKMINRFNTYKILSKKKKIRRIILVISKGST